MKKQETVVMYIMAFEEYEASPAPVNVYVDSKDCFIVVDDNEIEVEVDSEDLFVDYNHCDESCDEYNTDLFAGGRP